ncbi:MAG: hypothetical protein NVS4B7_05540 [Ktedonobacteraceae bacterium]
MDTFEPRERVLEAFSLAQRLAILCRALTWYRAVAYLEKSTKWEFEDSMPYFLRMFLHPDSVE